MSINLDIAKQSIHAQAQAIEHLASLIDEPFAKACQLILACRQRVVVTGMGKSGHIGNKIAATLASTGTPAFYVHPGEASHGDLGMITENDVILALSHSGETRELLDILPLAKRLGTPIITITKDRLSTLAKLADAALITGVETEACPLNLAPTSSTTAALVLGDALAICLLEANGFTANDFALSHPGGSLGKKLLLRVEDLMHQAEHLPKVSLGCTVMDALMEITHKGLGMTTVCATDQQHLGIFTDGDLRRAIDKGANIQSACIDELMTLGGVTIEPHALAAEALRRMEEHSISALVCVKQGCAIGVIHMHDLLRAGVA